MSHAAHVALSAATQARIAAGVLGALALIALRGCFVRLRRDRLVADTPLMRIRSAAQGYVKVAGRAAPAGQSPTASPLTSRPCVWWSYEISHRERDSKGNARWSTLEKAESAELFMLTDQDGQCLVGPVQAEITPTTRDVWYGDAARPGGPPGPASSVFSGDWRYTERLLSVNDPLCVIGDLRSHSELGDFNSATAAKLKEWKQDQKALLARFDSNHDGRIDAAEWDAARAAAAKESQTDTLHTRIARISVISKPANGQPFLIAPLSPEGLEKRERRFSALYFAAALLGVLLCAWALRHADELEDAERQPVPATVEH
ncbi:MAG TPA: GIDE domain-containing protein [Steroidobacteraceae bacterium]|nr:GIDE domain-containing protein [Steroidobacteraceae bacterium]